MNCNYLTKTEQNGRFRPEERTMPSPKRDAVRSLVLLVVILSASFLPAQEAPRFSETVDVSLVNVEVIVTDRDGRRVRGLKPEDFTILQDGKPQAIVNFAEYAAAAETTGVVVDAPAAAARTAEAAPRQPRTVLVFVDDVALALSRTDIRPKLAEVLGGTLQPGDTGALLSWSNRLNVRQGFTGDVDALQKAVQKLPAPGALFSLDSGALLQADRSFIENLLRDPRMFNMHSEDDSLPQLGPSLATTALFDLKTKTRAINSAMTAVAGAEGRKVLLLVTHRFSRHPTLEYTLGLRATAGAGVRPDWRYDARQWIDSVAETANATGFTIYALHPEGLQSTFATAEVSAPPDADDGPVGVRDNLILANETESLQLVTDRTGGEYAVGADSLELLPRVAEDLTDYYSIAYRTNLKGTDSRRKLTVRVKNRQYDVRARSEFVERSDETQMRDRVTASVFAPIDPGRLPIVVEFDRAAIPTNRLPLTIRIPIAGLTTVPQNGSEAGAFTVYVAWNTSGTVGEATHNTQRFTISRADLERAKKSHFTYTLEVRTDPTTRALGVGVLDETSKEFGVVTVPLTPERASAAPASTAAPIS